MPGRRCVHDDSSELFQLRLSHVRDQQGKAGGLSRSNQAFTAVPEVEVPLQAGVRVPGDPDGEGKTCGVFVKPDWRSKGSPKPKKKHTASFLHRTNHVETRKIYEHDADDHGDGVSWQNAGAIYNQIGRILKPLWATIDMSVSAAEDAQCGTWYLMNCSRTHLHGPCRARRECTHGSVLMCRWFALVITDLLSRSALLFLCLSPLNSCDPLQMPRRKPAAKTAMFEELSARRRSGSYRTAAHTPLPLTPE